MGIFVAWMRAKAMASDAATNGKGKQRGAVLVEYLILAGAALGIAVGAADAYYTNIAAEFTDMAASVLLLF